MSLIPVVLSGSTSVWYLLRHLLWPIALFGSFTSTIFIGMVLAGARRYLRRSGRSRERVLAIPVQNLPAVTILKPLYGMERELERNLESFFQQDYPDFEIVFGTRNWDDPALRVVEKLSAKYPQIPTRTVVSGEPFWPNAKVFSLTRMFAGVTGSHFVISDSDVLVRPDFLRSVVPPLLDPKVGLVTCLYKGIPAEDFCSQLEALGMSVEMSSGVMVADMMEGGMRFAMGAVMAVRRDALEAAGGIRSLADFCADDFLLGNRIAKAGYEVVLSHYKVGHVLASRSLQRSFSDQLRWMKSTRFSRPLGHVGSGLIYAVPFGLLALLLALGHGRPELELGLGLFVAACLNRIVLSLVVGWGIVRDRRALWFCWLYPLRDLVGFGVWAASFSGRTFRWRGETYQFGSEGRIAPEQRDFELVGQTLPQGHD